MDKETAVAIAELKAAVNEQAKDLKNIEEKTDLWDKLVRGALIKIVTWLILVGGTGLVFGWKMPPDIRRNLIEWISR